MKLFIDQKMYSIIFEAIELIMSDIYSKSMVEQCLRRLIIRRTKILTKDNYFDFGYYQITCKWQQILTRYLLGLNTQLKLPKI